jgi:hypothetical protein
MMVDKVEWILEKMAYQEELVSTTVKFQVCNVMKLLSRPTTEITSQIQTLTLTLIYLIFL